MRPGTQAPTDRPPLIVFTDLDGTLLDHDTYSFAPARPALDRLSALKAPVILASSKTAAEMIDLRAKMDLTTFPAIVENGAGVLPAQTDALPDGSAYDALRVALDTLPDDMRSAFRGFGDMTHEEISDVTGLPPEAARKAATRAFSEPGLWTGTDAQRAAFIKALAKHGITARMGGRFLTLGHGATKADQMRAIADHYGNPPSIALGDAPNDIEMLNAATIGVIIANPAHTPLPAQPGEAKGTIIRTTAPGPTGWAEAMTRLITEILQQSQEPTLG